MQQPILLTDSLILANITKSDILKFHNQNPNCLCILSDGRIASSGCDCKIFIYNSTYFTIDISIKEKTNSIIYITQLKNGTFISCSEDGYIHFYNISNNSFHLIHTVKSHEKPIYKVIEMTNGDLVSCSLDKTIINYDNHYNPNYIIVNEFRDMIHDVIEIRENEICACSAYNGFLFFYDFNTHIINGKMNKLNITPWNHSLKMISNNLLCIFGNDQMTIVNINKYTIVNKINTLKSNYLNCFIILNDRLITGDWNGNLKEWKISRNHIVLKTTMENAHLTGIMSIDVLHDGRLVTASQDKTIKIWS